MTLSRRWRYLLLLAISGVAVLALVLHGPISQPQSYHDFADQRTVLGIPHFANVISSATFLVAGIAGLWVMIAQRLPGAAYAVFFLAVIVVSLGSAFYHLQPDDATLVWDRLPMTIAFMAFVSIVISQHIDPALGRRLLPPLIAIGVFSVIYWRMSGDLRPYAIVQFLPMVLVPLILLLFPPLFSKSSFLWGLLAFYAVAKCFEIFDAPIYRAIGISGHTLKHLTSAAGVCFLVVAVRHLHYRHVRTGDRPPAHPPVAR